MHMVVSHSIYIYKKKLYIGNCLLIWLGIKTACCKKYTVRGCITGKWHYISPTTLSSGLSVFGYPHHGRWSTTNRFIIFTKDTHGKSICCGTITCRYVCRLFIIGSSSRTENIYKKLKKASHWHFGPRLNGHTLRPAL